MNFLIKKDKGVWKIMKKAIKALKGEQRDAVDSKRGYYKG